MKTHKFDLSRVSANDCSNAAACEVHERISEPEQVEVRPPLYGASKISPSHVGYDLPKLDTPAVDIFAEIASPTAQELFDVGGAIKVVCEGVTLSANDEGYNPPSHAVQIKVPAEYPASDITQPPSVAILLQNKARVEPSIAEQFQQVSQLDIHSLGVAQARVEAFGGSEEATERTIAVTWWKNPKNRLRLLYAALIPAVVIVNFSYESIRDKVRAVGRTLDQVATLQHQVEELKKPRVNAAPVVTPANVANPAQQPIPPNYIQGAGGVAGEIPLPSPMAASSDMQSREVKPLNVRAPKDHASSTRSAANEDGDDDSIPEEGKFILATDGPKPSTVVHDSKVPPPNEFKLISDK